MAEGKDGKGEGYEFVPPDFDEEAFIHRELVSFKTTAILFAWGIVAAAASWGAFLAVGASSSGWFIGLAICAAMGYSLKFIFPRLGADIAHFKRREWLGTGFLFFFTWLSFFILAINPPITDVAPPQVFVYGSPPLQEPGANATFHVVAIDNDRVASLDVHVTLDGNPLNVPLTTLGPGHVQGTLPAAPGTYAITATATDPHRHVGTGTANVTVGHVLDVTWPKDAPFTDADQVLVKTPIPTCAADYAKGTKYDCLRTVELRPTDGSPVIPLATTPDGNWRSDLTYAGWTAGNHTYQVIASYPKHFLAAEAVDGGSILGESHTLHVAHAGGTTTASVPPEPTQRAVQVPAPGIGLIAVAFLGLALLRRRASVALT